MYYCLGGCMMERAVCQVQVVPSDKVKGGLIRGLGIGVSMKRVQIFDRVKQCKAAWQERWGCEAAAVLQSLAILASSNYPINKLNCQSAPISFSQSDDFSSLHLKIIHSLISFIIQGAREKIHVLRLPGPGSFFQNNKVSRDSITNRINSLSCARNRSSYNFEFIPYFTRDQYIFSESYFYTLKVQN